MDEEGEVEAQKAKIQLFGKLGGNGSRKFWPNRFDRFLNVEFFPKLTANAETAGRFRTEAFKLSNQKFFKEMLNRASRSASGFSLSRRIQSRY